MNFVLDVCCRRNACNSSSGIIEAASFGTPVINVGSRQHLRERNTNVIDVSAVSDEICNVLDSVLKGPPQVNLYGDGRLVSVLSNFCLKLIGALYDSKSNAY